MSGRPSSQCGVHVEQPEQAQALVHPAVDLQQVHPGEHPHHVADPERRDQQREDQALAPAAEPGDVVGHRVRDRAGSRTLATTTNTSVRTSTGPMKPSAPNRCWNTYWNWVGSHWNGFQVGLGVRNSGSSVPKARARTTYSGQDEQEDQPDDPREGERRPDEPTARDQAPALNCCQIACHCASTVRRQLEQTLALAEQVLLDDDRGEVRRDGAVRDELGRRDLRLRRLVAGEHEVVEGHVVVEHVVEEQVRHDRVLASSSASPTGRCRPRPWSGLPGTSSAARRRSGPAACRTPC